MMIPEVLHVEEPESFPYEVRFTGEGATFSKGLTKNQLRQLRDAATRELEGPLP
ncbi:hypothetical protein ACFQJC_14550 [Haloferax namakaokahaiae]|uniref:Uncharacterized protein n=1 Tax=Haloferax namakaokahaiae TaxID=1748331 RepID=A0ABD5ZHL8_9EURY